MHNVHPKTTSRNRAARIAVVVVVCGIVAAAIVFGLAKYYAPKPAGGNGYLPKDVASTPAASPLASAPPETALRSDAVSITLPAGSSVGPNVTVTGTATAPDGTVYYRISDYRRGQIAAGQTTIPDGSAQPFSFRPEFSRVYTKGDPATLDVYVLNANGSEQTTRVTVTLQ